MEHNQEVVTLGKDYRYDELVDLIESIGYKLRCPNYYFIREDDGYINISYNYPPSAFNHRIDFHKNFYSPHPGKYDISENFDNFEDFYNFITDYHSKLFLKHKIEKLRNGIKNN